MIAEFLTRVRFLFTRRKPADLDEELRYHVEQSTEGAYEMAKYLGRKEGLLLGISAAAAVAASLKIGEEEARAGRNAVLVTILCDSADKYLSERFWEQ